MVEILWTRYVERINEFLKVNNLTGCKETNYFFDTDWSYNVPATNWFGVTSETQ